MIFDFRVFIGESFDGRRQTVEDLLRSMDASGIDRALVSPFKPLSYQMDDANKALVNSIKSHDDRLMGAVRVDPWQPSAVDTLRQGLEELGLRALYLNPWEEHFRADSKMVDPLIEFISKKNIPIIVETGFPWLCEPMQVGRLAKRWPDVSFVMTNGGQMNISGLGQADATLTLRDCPNIRIDTAGVYRQDFIEETIEAFGAERVLYASGTPNYDQKFEVKRVLMLNASAQVKQIVQAENALKLLAE
jgi:predicted TIM-barrel fold metal-dependent hydrolase